MRFVNVIPIKGLYMRDNWGRPVVLASSVDGKKYHCLYTGCFSENKTEEEIQDHLKGHLEEEELGVPLLVSKEAKYG